MGVFSVTVMCEVAYTCEVHISFSFLLDTVFFIPIVNTNTQWLVLCICVCVCLGLSYNRQNTLATGRQRIKNKEPHESS